MRFRISLLLTATLLTLALLAGARLAVAAPAADDDAPRARVPGRACWRPVRRT